MASARTALLRAALVGGLALLIPALRAAGEDDAIRAGFDERNLPPVTELLQTGDYDSCARLCEVAIARGQPSPRWWTMRIAALESMGRLQEAWSVAEELAKTRPQLLEAWMARYELALQTGKKKEAEDALRSLNEAAKGIPASKRTASDLIILGRAALAVGADPKRVIEQFFEPAKKKDKARAEACLALGQLALAKEDPRRAAEEFRAGLKERADDAELRYGLAKAFEPSDRKKCAEALEQLLARNPHHNGALCLQTSLLLASEKFTEAQQTLDRLAAVNPRHPEAAAYRAVLALLVGSDAAAADKHRASGLETWKENPLVDHVIGRCLSRAYRFAEGEKHQRAALAMAPDFLPAKLQLAQDLFRLGREEEGWKLAREVREADGYNVQAHNIGLLEEEMRSFVTRDEGDFVMRMPERDNQIYGDRALALLREARSVLGAKYGMKTEGPILVEFFPSQADFAIRTLGNLGGQGILGACFGTVVTMNSPGSLSAVRSNWESTLWHEFCHVVTLSVTNNRMPRWLSEGISVHEERLRDASWGMKMSTESHAMLSDDETLTPVGQLTSAFLNAKDSDALLFAYFESAEVVRYLSETYGMEKFRGILRDLAAGVRINEAIAKNTVPVEQLEPAFVAHIRAMAKQAAPLADWSEPDDTFDASDPGSAAAYVKEHPGNLQALRAQAAFMLSEKKWDAAAEVATRVIRLFPDDVGKGGGYDLAAAAHRGAGRDREEMEVLRAWTKRSGDAAEAFNRLMTLHLAAGNWEELASAAQRSLAINPFLKLPNEALASAAEARGESEVAVAALQKLLVLGPDNPVETNFKLARLLQDKDRAAARRYLLDALSEAPRFREGQRLLLKMQSPAR